MSVSRQRRVPALQRSAGADSQTAGQHRQGGGAVGFTVFSEVEIPTERVPAAALAYLLQRNRELFVTWEMAIRDNGNVAFALNYVPLPPASISTFSR